MDNGNWRDWIILQNKHHKMKLINNLVLVWVICAISLAVSAQKENDTKKHQIGIHAGMTNGAGFSYRFIPKKLGFQITAVSFFTRNEELIQSQGASLIYIIKNYPKLETFTYLGGAYSFSNRMSEQDKQLSANKKYRDIISTGGGIGMNIYLGKSFDFNFQVGVTVITIKNNQKIYPSGGIGIFYKF